MSELTDFKSGFAYVEVIGVYNTTVDRKPMLDKNHNPMICIRWSVVDSEANTGIIKSYVSSVVKSVIANLENSLHIKQLFVESTKQFDCDLLLNKSCGAVIRKDDNPKYGFKIEKYIPLEVFNHFNENVTSTLKNNNTNDTYKKSEANYMGMKREDTQRLLDEQGVEFDDIPF